MIDTGVARSSVYITDYVTSENIERARTAYKSCSLFIDKKFPMPMSDVQLNFNDNQTIQKIVDDIPAYFSGLNETQLKNIKSKVAFWCLDLFCDVIAGINRNERNLLVFIDNSVSKHEWYLIHELFKFGVSFFIISETLDYANGSFNNTEKREQFNSGGSLNYKVLESEIIKFETLKNLDDVENAIYTNSQIFEVAVIGTDGHDKTVDFYGKLRKRCNEDSGYTLYNTTLGQIKYEFSSKIPRLQLIDANYLIQTISMFFMCGNEDTSKVLKQALQDRFATIAGTIPLQKLLGKLIYTVCKTNEIFSSGVSTIVFYGAPSENDAIVLDVISRIHQVNIIVLSSDKSKPLETKYLDVVTLNNSEPFFEMPVIDSRDVVKTTAALVERQVNAQLFDGQTLGLYKPGQFNKFSCTRFSTTFEELQIYWNQDLYLRVGFETSERSVRIPSIFKVICGVADKMDNERFARDIQYTLYISRLFVQKTFLFRNASMLNQDTGDRITSGVTIKRLTDLSAPFNMQVPIFVDGKLDRNLVRSLPKYSYSFLSMDKQEAIFDCIERLINGNLVNYESYGCSKASFMDIALSLLLNLNVEILRVIQWYNYYSASPKVIMVMPDETGLSLTSVIMLVFLSLMGFDVALFVPTCYNSIESRVTEQFVYDKHVIGEACMNINTNNIRAATTQLPPQAESKPQSIFSRIFRKGEK